MMCDNNKTSLVKDEFLMGKNGNFLKKVGLALLSILIVASTIFQTTIVKAATSYGSQFLNTVELLDKDGVPQTNFGYYDNMDVHYTWSIPNSKDVKAGDTMDFTLPSQLALATDLAFDVKDSKGQVVGTATVKRETNQVTLVFSDYVEKHSDIKGELDFWTAFNQKIITGNETINLEFPLGYGTTGIDVGIGEKKTVSPTETLFKYGWVDASNPSLIHWVVRVNYAKANIPSAFLMDTIGAKQILNFDSIKAFHGTYSADGVFTAGTPISSTNFSATSDGFRVDIGTLTDSVQISYTTTATDGGKSTQYDNTATLMGIDFATKQTSTWTPASGGGGDADGTTGSVTLTKKDAKTKATLTGAEFKLIDSKGTILQENIATDANGQLTIANLKFDTYQLIETKAPDGYKLDATPVEFTIGENNNAITVTKENTLNTGSVELTKLDATTKATLAGATFELQDKDGNTLQTGLTTDENGVLTVTDLVPGTYQFVETNAPIGYEIDTSPVIFEIVASETDQPVKVTKENTPETPTPPIPVPPVPNEPTIPPAKPEVPVTPNKPEPSKKSPISTKVSTTIKLPKTGDTPLVNGWGILLVAISAGGLIALRRK